jgi:hypothetical protein
MTKTMTKNKIQNQSNSLDIRQTLVSISFVHLYLAKFSVCHSIPFNDFHGNIVQVCLFIKQKHVGFLTPLAKLAKMSVGFLTPLGSVGFLTPFGSVGFFTPLSSVGFLTPFKQCRLSYTFQQCRLFY